MSERTPEGLPGAAVDEGFESLLVRAAKLTPLPAAAARAARIGVGMTICRGRFEVRRLLGEGGMGMVYEAFDRQRRELVALKALMRLDADAIYRLKNEFRGLSEVVHPNLVRLHELFADAESWLFSMERVDGVAFDGYVRPNGNLDEERLRGALQQLCLGVQAIHRAGKLHRDLKPSNVLVDAQGRVVILDFGLSSDPEPGGVGQTVDEPWVTGTPAYMPPEQADGRGATTASDWYAVGCMLFEALAGRLPFEGGAGAIMDAKWVAEAPDVAGLAPRAPRDLAALTRALLAKEPSARPDAAAVLGTFGSPQERGSRTPNAAAKPARRPLPLLGRERENATLHEALAGARAGTATVVCVRGESGIGKSALLGRFADEISSAEGAVVLRGRCFERESLPFNAFDRVVDELSRYLRRLSPAEGAALMPRDIHALARIFPVLQRLEVVKAAPVGRNNDAPFARQRAFSALGELFARIRDRVLLVVLIDDVQWIDEDSLLLFDHLLRTGDTDAILWLLSKRAESAHVVDRLRRAASDNQRVSMHILDLEPLSSAASTALAHAVLSEAGALEALAQRVALEAAGNPFLIIELARHLASTGPQGEASLEQALVKRLAALDEKSRLMLQLTALCAGPVPECVLIEAAGPAGDLHRSLDLLRDAQLLRASPEQGLLCYHDRIRVAVAGHLSGEAARAHHARLALAFANAKDTDPEVLLWHHRAAGWSESAGSHAITAAKRAVDGLAFERAAELYGQALSLLTAEVARRECLVERKAEALSLAGRWRDAGAAFEDALGRADSLPRRSYLLHETARHYLASGHAELGLQHLRELFAGLRLRWPRSRAGALVGAVLRLVLLRITGAKARACRPPTERMERFGHEHLYPAHERAAPSSAVVLHVLLSGAGLVPPYDLLRGTYFMATFCTQALRSGEPATTSVAFGLLAVMFAAHRTSAALSRRLADQARQLVARHPNELSGAALVLISFSNLLHGRCEAARLDARDALARLPNDGRSHAYEAWTARSIQAYSLVLMGRLLEAEELLARNKSEARALDDDLAILGGESPLGLLLRDDTAGMREMLSRKRAALSRVGSAGALRAISLLETICAGLYEGNTDGREPELSRWIILFDPGGLLALRALQAIERGQRRRSHMRLVARSMLRLRRAVSPLDRAVALQLRAALHLLARRRDDAVRELNGAIAAYATGGFHLHEHIARYRLGALLGDAGAAQRQEAEAFLRGQGIVNPSAWARMLAPGLESPPDTRA